VHGEPESQAPLAAALSAKYDAPVSIAKYGQVIDI
jgi:hypothetical protein